MTKETSMRVIHTLMVKYDLQTSDLETSAIDVAITESVAYEAVSIIFTGMG